MSLKAASGTLGSGSTVRLVVIDLSDREVLRIRCDRCGSEYDRVVIFVTWNGAPHAVVSAVCHGHPNREVWLDATFGSWVEPFADHVTMSCRVSEAGAGLVDPLVASAGNAEYYGKRLSRNEALEDPRLPVLWSLVDEVVIEVREVRDQVYGTP